MSTLTAYDDIETRLKTAWTATPIIFENEKYELPASPTPFVYCEVFGDDYTQETAGAPQQNMFQEQGALYMHVLVPNETGTREARGYCTALLNLFREQQIGSVRPGRMSIGQGQPGRDFANYWTMTATLWWHRYDITDLT